MLSHHLVLILSNIATVMVNLLFPIPVHLVQESQGTEAMTEADIDFQYAQHALRCLAVCSHRDWSGLSQCGVQLQIVVLTIRECVLADAADAQSVG